MARLAISETAGVEAGGPRFAAVSGVVAERVSPYSGVVAERVSPYSFYDWTLR